MFPIAKINVNNIGLPGMASMIVLQTQFSIVSQTAAGYNHGNLYSDVADSKRQHIKLDNREIQIL